MRAARDAFLESLEPQVVELVTLIAERILRRECATDRDLILRTVRRALEVISDRQRLTVRLNPDDAAALRAHEIRLLEEFPGLQPLLIEPDAAITPGGCTVESATAHVDARLETLLAGVIDALLDRSHEPR
jgi:flagellar assembly protein FliH